MQPFCFFLFVALISFALCWNLSLVPSELSTNATTSQPPRPSQCTQGWTYFQGLCYGYGKSFIPWGDAQAVCQSRGGRLAEVSSLEESECVWIGGSDIFVEGVWEWSSKPNTFDKVTNWGSGKPNNANGNEDCLSMSGQLDYKWNDESCTDNCNFICVTP